MKAKLVVQDQRRHHPWRAQEDHTQVCFCIGQNGCCGPQQHCQGFQEQLAKGADHRAGGHRQKETGDGHGGRGFIVLLAKLPRDEISAAVAEEEADGLDNRHQGKHNANRAGGTVAFQHTDKECIRHVVESRYQHTDNAWRSHAADQGANGRFGHQAIFFLLHPVRFAVHLQHLLFL